MTKPPPSPTNPPSPPPAIPTRIASVACMRAGYCSGWHFASIVVLATLGACRVSAPPAPVPEHPRVAVLAFDAAAEVSVPEGLGTTLGRTLAAKLATAGVPVVDPDRVFGATGLVDTGVHAPPLAARVAQKVDGTLGVYGVVTRYRDRIGSAWAVQQSASVAYQATLVRAADGSVLDEDRFDYTQQALSENLLDRALEATAERFAAVLAGRRAPRVPPR